MHLPVLALLARAVGRFGRLHGQQVDRLECETVQHVLDLCCLDVLFVELGGRLTDVLAAEWSLVVGEVDHRNPGFLLPLEQRPVDAENELLGPISSGRVCLNPLSGGALQRAYSGDS
jgi:hypothetical protein